MIRPWHGILPALLFATCAPKPSEILLDTEKTPSHVLLERVREHGEHLQSLQGRGIVSFDTPELSGSAAFEVNMKKPDSLLVTFEGPLGIDVGTFFLSKQRFVMYNSLENTLITGKPTEATMRSFIPMNLSHDQIMSAFAGIIIAPQEHEVQKYNIDGDQFFLATTCDELVCKFWIDPKYLLVTRYEIENAAGTAILEARLSAFTTDETAAAPKRISIRMPQQSRWVTIAYNDLSLNPDTDFRYKIPSNARIVNPKPQF